MVFKDISSSYLASFLILLIDLIIAKRTANTSPCAIFASGPLVIVKDSMSAIKVDKHFGCILRH